MSNSSPPPGTADIFPAEVYSWYRLEEAAKKIFQRYGYGELRTPVFEYTEVFKRGLGDETEVVQKEMYTFEDRGGRSLTLRPEGTAGVMRALSGTDAVNGTEHRVFYIGPMFRGERPAAGRRRQFHQIGVENVGRVSPELDAECISMLVHFLSEIGISGFKVKLNTRGVENDRKPAEDALREYFSPHISGMCEDCRNRLNKNVWRILDCKQQACRIVIDKAPEATSFFTQETKDYFRKVCDILTKTGIDFEIDPMLVRGLDYYVHTVFEFVHSGLGAQNAIAGGGRYEIYLPENKKPIIGVGFAAGMERLLMVQDALNVPKAQSPNSLVYMIGLGQAALDANTLLAAKLRRDGLTVISEVENKSMKAQMRSANRLTAAFVLISGETELEKKIIVCKNMASGEQEEVPIDGISAYLKSRLIS